MDTVEGFDFSEGHSVGSTEERGGTNPQQSSGHDSILMVLRIKMFPLDAHKVESYLFTAPQQSHKSCV